MPQRMSWITGMMAVIFFKDGKQDRQEEEAIYYSNLEDDLAETIGVINPHCRFESSLCTSLEHIHLSISDSLIIPFLQSDGLAHLPHHTDLDDHYELLTKRALTLSGLPTPNAQLVDFGRPETGWESETLNCEVAWAISAIHYRVRLFVLKSNSSGGSWYISSLANSRNVCVTDRQVAIDSEGLKCKSNGGW